MEATPALLARSNPTSLSDTLARLSSGLRVRSAADDAAGAAVAVSLDARTREATVGKKTVLDGQMMLRVAEDGADAIVDTMQRMRAVAVEAVSDTRSAADRAELEREFRQLYTEVDRIAESTASRGRELLDGRFGRAGFGALEVQVGAGEAGRIAVDIAQLDTGALGLGGDRVQLESGAVGVEGVTARGLHVTSGTLSLSVSVGTEAPAELTGTTAVASELTTSGDLVLAVDGTDRTTSFTGGSAAELTGSTASSTLSGGGDVVLAVDGVSYTATLTDPRTQELVGQTAAPSTIEASGDFYVSSAWALGWVDVQGDSAAAFAFDTTASSITTTGELTLVVDGSAETVSLQAAEAPTLTGSVASSSTGGDLELVVDGTSYWVGLAGETPAMASSSTVTGPLPNGTISFDVGGTSSSATSTDGLPRGTAMRSGPGTQGSVGIVDVLMYNGALAYRRAYIPHTATYGLAASIVHTLAVNLGGGLSGTEIYGNSTRRGSYVEVRTGG